MFSALIPWYSWLLLALMAAGALLFWISLWPMVRFVRYRIPYTPSGEGTKKGLTVVVYARNDEMLLRSFLTRLQEQDYPGFQVLVVYDSDAETAAALSEALAEAYPNVRISFMPPGSHNVSRRKLWIMLGMKGAETDYVLLTSSNCEIPSPRWISEMMAPVEENPSIELVLGICHNDPSEWHGLSKWYHLFRRTVSTAYEFGYAIMGKPYRADDYNMVMSRELFFRHKGFAKTMHLDAGEDDLFIEEISTPDNTAVAVSPDSILTARWELAAKRVRKAQRERHSFTQHYLPKGPFIRRSLASFSQWLILGGAVAAGITALPNLIPAIVCAALLIAMWTGDIILCRKCANKEVLPPLLLSPPLYFLWTPIGNLSFRIRNLSHRYKNFTWQRPK